MLYLVQHIIFCLLFIAVIGVAVGWLLRGVGSSRHSEMVAAEWKARVAHLESKNDTGPAADRSAGPAAATDVQTDALRRRLAEAERELATLRTARAVRTQTEGDDSAREELRETRLVCQQLQGHIAEQRTLHEQLKNRLQLAASERATLVGRLRDLEKRCAQLNQERQHAMDTITGLQKDLRASQVAQTAAVRASSGEPRARPAAEPDKAAVRPAAARAAAPTPEAGDAPAAQQSLPIAETAPPAAPKPYEPAWRLSAPDGAADNLQAIYGIGPKIEQRLNELGVFHFRQIASFEKPDILWVARHLKSFPGRILRDRWVEQARSLEKRRRAGQPI